MCGIAGFCNFECNYTQAGPFYTKILTDMHDRLSHRGNDRFENYLKENIGFSLAHMNICDRKNGTHSMAYQINGREYAIVYDGEIYNTDELISALKSAGYTFFTTSDEEIILYCYLHYGVTFVNRLNGFFAFAIWDDTRQQLYLYRDRIGCKPLFYYLNGQQFIFASEPKALFCYPNIQPRLNTDGLREVLGIGPARTAGNGIFEHVHEVLPGHYMCYDKNGFSDHGYWDLFAYEHTDSYEATVDNVSWLVRDAVKKQMVSDSPVCAFLSGGIDSSIVTAIAGSYLSERGETLDTFSFDFKGNDQYFQSNAFQPERDIPYVNAMLSYCTEKGIQLHHTYLECDETLLSDTLYAAVDARDYPGMADIDASLLYFCSLVNQHNKVALTGECSDEIFGGYPWFYRPELLNSTGFPWSSDLSARTMFLKEEWISSLDLTNYSYDKYQSSLMQAPTLPGESGETRRRRQINYLCIKWFMQTLLDRMDRAGMYSGLAARVPFADHRIIEYVFNVPWEMKYQNGVEKSLLRAATADLLPPELLHRKKSPYPKTYHPGYEHALCNRFTEIIKNPNAPIMPLIDVNKALHFMESPKEYGKPWYGQLMAGPQLIAYYIQLNYWMEKYHLSL